MNDFTDHLESWWNHASVASPREGDTIIFREAREDGSHYYGIETAEEDFAGDDNTRILHRAPKPKPAWHDAVAVIARTGDFGLRRVFVRDGDGVWNDALSGRGARASGLRAVTPLIEAKVTDEMRDRLWDAICDIDWDGSASLPECEDEINALLTAALGIDPE